ncbi:hypothetical protein BDD12DRAFT_829924 [Trichophaea hybrida]|nr:hypothetical protein BDD12DRAFT_829924 [Trichophaea hybrida]
MYMYSYTARHHLRSPPPKSPPNIHPSTITQNGPSSAIVERGQCFPQGHHHDYCKHTTARHHRRSGLFNLHSYNRERLSRGNGLRRLKQHLRGFLGCQFCH